MKEALKLALEALESMSGTLLELGEQTTFNEDQAITAIKAALAQPAQERNFCSRCGKRTADLTMIHTCTPPQKNA